VGSRRWELSVTFSFTRVPDRPRRRTHLLEPAPLGSFRTAQRAPAHSVRRPALAGDGIHALSQVGTRSNPEW
jgi:hypothetical protein